MSVELVYHGHACFSIHYDTFDLIRQDPYAFAARVEAETQARCVVLKPGDKVSL